MGLAAYGRPTMVEQVRKVIRRVPDGSFALAPEFFEFQTSAERSYSSRFVDLFGPARHPYDPLDLESADGQRLADCAASVQRVLEETLVEIAAQVHRDTGLSELCFGGGVALNGLANARILSSAGFERVFVPPAPGDAGCAMGAALYADRIYHGRPDREIPDHPFWGPSADGHQLARAAREDNHPVEELDYLARPDRVVIGADLSRTALRLGSEAARRYGIQGVQFVETDLHRPGLKPAAFDVVYSSGVLHHTPDPRSAFARIAELARPGGIVIVRVYNTFARLPLRIRRAVARLTAFRIIPFDPVLEDRDHEPARREAWLRDQYQHPEEHTHTVAEVHGWFADHDVEYLRSVPSTVFGDEGEDVLTHAEDDWNVESWIAQVGWMWTLGREGGLFLAVGRRR